MSFSLDQKQNSDLQSTYKPQEEQPTIQSTEASETQHLSESDGEEAGEIEKKNSSKFKNETTASSIIQSPVSSIGNSASSLCALETNLSDNSSEPDRNQLTTASTNPQLTNQLTIYQQWHEKPRSLSDSSSEAFCYQQHLHHAKLEPHSTTENTSYHYSQTKSSSANQSPCCYCYNNLYKTTSNTCSSNSGSSSHDSISVSQLSISTSTAAISSLGSVLSSTTPNINSNNQGIQTTVGQQSNNITTTHATLVSTTSSFNQQQAKITTSTVVSSSHSKSEHEEQRSRSATGCLFITGGDEQQTTSQSPKKSDQSRSSPHVVKQAVGLTKSDQESTALRHAKSQTQSSRRPTNRLANESTPEATAQSNRSMRSRNLLLQHQLHKSLSTPTLIVHEEQIANQSSERSSALSKIKNKITGNSSNSNISAIKAGTTSLFSTVRDKLLQHEYVFASFLLVLRHSLFKL